MSSSEDTLIFLHITKTAGGTLRGALDAQADLGVYFAYGPQPADIDYGSFDIVYGHQLYGFHEKHGLAPRYAAVLRQPLARCISHYYHLRNVDKSHVGDRIRESSDINDFFESREHWEFDNLMCRVLSGDGRKVTDMADTRSRAIANLEQFAFIGVQEFFPYVMSDLNDLLGCDLPSVPNVNVGAYERSEISDETVARIQDLNRDDELLYWAAMQRLANNRLSGTQLSTPAIPTQAAAPADPESYHGIRKVFMFPGVKSTYRAVRDRLR